MSRQAKLLLLGVLGVILCWQLYSLCSTEVKWENPPHLIGTRDLRAFWGGVQVFIGGENPYDASKVFALQQKIFPEMTQVQAFLNPPWALPIYLPFMVGPFEFTRYLWLLVNLFCVGAIAWLVRELYGLKDIPSRHLLPAAICFLPSLMIFWMGQSTLLVATALLACIWALCREKDFLAAFFAVPLALKPHLVFLPVLVLGLWAIWNRRWIFIASGAGLLFALIGIVELWCPGLLSEWHRMDFNPLYFRTSTLAARARGWQQALTGNLPIWPLVLFPVVGCIGGVLWFWKNRSEVSLEALPALTCWSLILAPYAWFYDYSLLLFIQVLIAARAVQGAEVRWKSLLLLALIQLAVLVTGALDNDLGAHFWLPIVFLVMIHQSKSETAS